MRLGTVSTIVALATLAALFAADAQPPAKVPRVGILWFGSPAAGPSPYLDAFGKACASSATSRDGTSPSNPAPRPGSSSCSPT
jgi:hypothetical protein